MGFFSWMTADTGESISNLYSHKGPLPVKMLMPDGTVYEEPEYEGYGEFGGVDIYDAIAMINGLGDDRQKGIEAVFKDNDGGGFGKAEARGIKTPRLVTMDFKGSYADVPPNEDCPYQGYFYEDDDPPDEDPEDDDYYAIRSSGDEEDEDE